jgi:hypothetical protein
MTENSDGICIANGREIFKTKNQTYEKSNWN